MGIEVEGPDGKVHSFPDNTPHDQIMGEMSRIYNAQGSLSASTPQAGSATAASGAVMPHMSTMPAYQSQEDMRQLFLTQMFPHAQQIIQNTPGHKMRVANAEAVGKDLAKIEEKQRAGSQILNVLGQLRTTADEADKTGSLSSAIGPLEGNQWAQKMRAAVPILGSAYEDAYNTNNRLHHIIHGLTTAFVSASGGQNMSDARQKAFEETMGAMMNATSKKEFDKILHDAELIIRDTFSLSPGQPTQPQTSSRGRQPEAVRRTFINNQTGQPETFEARDGRWVKVQ